jgi:hypothetical protein
VNQPPFPILADFSMKYMIHLSLRIVQDSLEELISVRANTPLSVNEKKSPGLGSYRLDSTYARGHAARAFGPRKRYLPSDLIEIDDEIREWRAPEMKRQIGRLQKKKSRRWRNFCIIL